MLLIGIVVGVCVVLGVTVYLIGRRIGWDKIERRNQRFIDGNGDHAYYDRKKH
ncbi:MAG: hypothetical protein LIP09_15345 [Bacteroidales bacterium]|nr:hypothetical protein [Bacteroidales bacterium]